MKSRLEFHYCILLADTAATEVQKKGLRKVALLGTKFTMEQDFYKGRLASRHGIEVLVPDPAEREVIHSVIYSELVLGKILGTSRQAFVKIIEHMQHLGAEGIVLGCTEIPLIITQKDCTVPVFDTMQIHAAVAVEFSLK
ncbi:aspartate/glutamate racemase family protein [Sporomusa aerivorans]|uniref:aspartate/glutamate racemase family protein n=1 Tax=Sporomusa aerivorans TaxID=204936 RepID=UPI00352B009B